VKASLALAARLRDLIASGELAAGDSLPVESELEAEYNLSKPVVREALRILETEGLVEVKRGLGGGPRVRHPTIDQAAQGMGVYLKIGEVPMTDVLATRDAIISACMERLADRRSEIDLAAIEAVVSDLRDRVGSVEGYYLYIVEAGDVVVELGGSEVDRILVGALRPLITAELEDASGAVVDVEEAIAVQRDVADAWARGLRNIKAGHGRAARLAYEGSARFLREGLAKVAPGLTVGDLYRRSGLHAKEAKTAAR
jgi:DNA-binding FadR family transcriptional regulator